MKGYRLVFVLLWALAFFPPACGNQSIHSTDWQLIVPDHYQGFLVIEYDCPTGSPLSQSVVIAVHFQDNGTFCTSSRSFAWEGEIHAKSNSGRVIEQSTGWNDTSSYGLYGDGLLTAQGPPKREFEIYWVGDLAYLYRIRNTPTYGQELDRYFQTNFGLQLQ